MSLTTDPNHPRLGRGIDREPRDQHEVYLVLSEAERAKGFVRPFRDSYKHVGIRPRYPLRSLKPEEEATHAGSGYAMYEEYPPQERPRLGRYWTREQLGSGCGAVTTMGRALSETYARNPKFYGATYCCGCRRHLPVEEFVWTSDGERVGS